MCSGTFTSGATVKQKCPDSCAGKKGTVKVASNALLPLDIAQSADESDLTPEDYEEADSPAWDPRR